jgi:MHS family proline/betaine transporter-like MFS transporter
MSKNKTAQPNTKTALPIAIASNFIEYYDYAIYGFFAATLATIFFPEDTHTIALIKSWGIFAIGSLAKPLGAYVFGRLGDSLGRRWSLRWNIFGIGLSTLAIAVLPGYDHLSLWAPILLLSLRFLQGFFYGGEVDGIRIYVLEHVGNRAPCFANSLSSLSSSLGVAVAGWIGMNSSTFFQPLETWRIAFSLGGFGALLIFSLRAFLPETPSFKFAKKTMLPQERPFWQLLKNHFRIFISIILLSACVSGSYYFLMLFGPTLWSKLLQAIPSENAKALTKEALWVYTLLLPISGKIADYFSAKKTFVFSLISLLFLSLFFFFVSPALLIQSYHHITLMGILLSFLNVSTYVLMIERIPVLHRYQLIAVAHALGSSLLASSVPFVGTLLWQKTGNFFYLSLYFLSLVSAGLLAFALLNPVKVQKI